MAKKLTHEQLKKRALSDPVVKAEYDALEDEFSFLQELVNARKLAHKTQAEIAESMGTTTSVVGRLESGGGKRQHSPSLGTLKRYARAVGCELKIRLVPKRAHS